MAAAVLITAAAAVAGVGGAPGTVLAATHKLGATHTAGEPAAAPGRRLVLVGQPALLHTLRAAAVPDITGGEHSLLRAGIVPPENPPANVPADPRLAGALCTSTTTGTQTTYHCDNPCANAKAVLAGEPPSINGTAACTQAAVAAINRA
ncbi:MAG TPA: hypothetical protein VMD59_12750, partial [Acidimicrobiales bacterium]|nr:hypothetical protein [Acidimicrobiales bacterium]